jgi:hypothetical protein
MAGSLTKWPRWKKFYSKIVEVLKDAIPKCTRTSQIAEENFYQSDSDDESIDIEDLQYFDNPPVSNHPQINNLVAPAGEIMAASNNDIVIEFAEETISDDESSNDIEMLGYVNNPPLSFSHQMSRVIAPAGEIMAAINNDVVIESAEETISDDESSEIDISPSARGEDNLAIAIAYSRAYIGRMEEDEKKDSEPPIVALPARNGYYSAINVPVQLALAREIFAAAINEPEQDALDIINSSNYVPGGLSLLPNDIDDVTPVGNLPSVNSVGIGLGGLAALLSTQHS